jgi:tRNA A37 threonylcarbamoyladenosine modification protein TsaB
MLKIIKKNENNHSINPHSVNPNYLKLTEAEEKIANI